jgi:ABC-type lipoprotein release transport system permease subunit
VVSDDAPALRAIGMTRAQLAGAAVRAHLMVAGIAVAVALATAVLASRWFPLGLGARIDPRRGVHADWLVIGPGVIIVAALTLSATALVAWIACRRAALSVASTRSGPFAWVRRAAPVTVGLGTTMAFDRGSGRRRVPTGAALVGAVVGVLGVVATMTMNNGLRDALGHPERAGVAWDAAVRPVDATQAGLRPLTDRAGAAPDVSTVGLVDRVVVDVAGVGVPTFTVRPPPGGDTSIELVTIAGRAPRHPDEMAVGPATAAVLHVGIGDTVVVGAPPRRVRVVGKALFPSSVHSAFDEGAWLTPRTFDAAAPPAPTEGSPDRLVVLRFRDGVDVEAATGRLAEAFAPAEGSVETVEVPVELSNLRNVRRLPSLLAGFLALLAVAALGHVLATSVRRRRQDFAVLRALGINGRGVRLILFSQGSAIAAAGIVLGIPLGLGVGRMGWQAVADQVPLRYVSPFRLLAIAAVIPVAIAAANLLAVWPGRRAAKLQPSEVLRSE